MLQRLQPVVGNIPFLLTGFSFLKINSDSIYLSISVLGSTLGFSQIGIARFLTTKSFEGFILVAEQLLSSMAVFLSRLRNREGIIASLWQVQISEHMGPLCLCLASF